MKALYGLTHADSGEPIIREVTTCKIGIGLPQGRDIHVYIDGSNKWVVKVGKDKVLRFDTRAEARKSYLEEAKTAPERKFPGKIQYFTFTRVSADGNYQPDFDMIELHGPLPTEVPIIFFRNEPLKAEYAYFTALEKKCSGDGKDARRVVTLFTNKDQEAAAERARDAGERYYDIEDGCWTRGCPFAKPTEDGGKHYPSACKPHGRLLLQFLKAPTLGATAYFDTTGRRSISQLFSCLQDFREFTGHGDVDRGHVAGIPLWLTVRPYRATFMQSGVKKTSTQYGVGIEFRPEGIEPGRLVESLIAAGEEYRQRTEVRQLTEGPIAVRLDGEEQERELVPAIEMTAEEVEDIEADQEEFIPESAEAIASEFYPEGENPDDDAQPVEGAESQKQGPKRKKKEKPIETEPTDTDKVRIHCSELMDSLAQKNCTTIFTMLEDVTQVRALRDVPDDKLEALEKRLTIELKRLS